MRSDFSLPLGRARLDRPSSPTRLTFHHFLTRFRDFRPSRDSQSFSLIPIEACAPGDSQVLAAREPAQTSLPIINLDSLAQFPSVESIVASTQIQASVPLPHISELLLTSPTHFSDASLFRLLSGLTALFAYPVAGGGKLDLLSLPAPQMKQLAISHWFTKDLAPLQKMTALTHLKANFFRDSLEPIAGMHDLEFLYIDGPAKGWAKLRECSALEEAHFIDVQIANLRRWNTWKKLRALTLTGRGLKSLAGLESSQALQQLTLINLAMDNLTSLSELPRLESLTLRMVAGKLDLPAISKIPNLRFLEIDDAAASTPLHVSTLLPLRSASNLQDLALLKTVVDDADLLPLADLPALRKVRLSSRIGADVEKLRQARPDLEIHYTPPDPKLAALQEVVGSVTILKPGAGLDVWSILQSFAPALNLKTNYDAERSIQHEIKKSLPELAKRLDWDTEAEAVGIYAKSESDIRSVASLINDLLREPPRKK